jgi:hypothetical protein
MSLPPFQQVVDVLFTTFEEPVPHLSRPPPGLRVISGFSGEAAAPAAAAARAAIAVVTVARFMLGCFRG